MTSALTRSSRSHIAHKEKTLLTDGAKKSLPRKIDRRLRMAATCFGLLLLMAMAFAPAAFAGAPDFRVLAGIPNTVEPGHGFRFALNVVNTGTAPFTGTVTVTDVFPAGMVPTEGEGNCEITGQQLSCGEEFENLQPTGQVTIFVRGFVEESASGLGTNTVRAEGNGYVGDYEAHQTVNFDQPAPFAVNFFEPSILKGGTPEVQAGATPDVLATPFEVTSKQVYGFGGLFPVATGGVEQMRNTIAHTPPGVVANLNATPVQCTLRQLSEPLVGANSMNRCPTDSQIGTVRLFGKHNFLQVYNMVPPPGTPAEFGFNVLEVVVLIKAKLRPDDFGFDVFTENVNNALPLADVNIELWGDPAASAHDSARGVCLSGIEGNSRGVEPDGLCSTDAPRKAFLRLPTSCTGPLQWSMEADSYQNPGAYSNLPATTPAQVGCNQLEFTPTLKARPTTNVADSPSGLEFSLHLPQNEDPEALAEAQLKDLTAVLPEGFTVNAASADGLGACSPQQIGMTTPVGQVPAKFNGEHAQCPDSSKLGSVSVYAPAVGRTLPGLVYLATPHENPFGSLVALYLAVDDPQTGIVVKVPVEVLPDPKTGQLTTVVTESAPLPFEDFKVELDQGPHAAMQTPISCGTFSTSSDLTPWSAPEGQDAHPGDSFEIVKGAGGGACVSSEAAAPAAPNFEAGTLEPKAGAYSPLVFKLARKAGGQQLTRIDATLPKGLLARLASSTYCSEGAIAAAAGKAGHAEQAQASCPGSSEIGTVEIGVGAGPAPMHIKGKVYIAGPYKGAPLSLAVITPAVAGPFDLGTIVTRVALQVDPETAQVKAISDPIPYILQGLPVDIRTLSLFINRPNYIVNPTSCNPMALTGSVSLLTGQTASVSNPFQVGGCANLSFQPKLALRLKGGTTRTAHPALTATLSFPKAGGANVAQASVALPHSEFLDQSHIGTICTRVQFAVHQCPAKSVYGTAKAVSPLLAQPLEGPVYLRSSSHELPDLVAALNGQFEIDLVGRIDSKNGGIRTTFESVPDAPVSTFTLKMRGGKKGLLQNSVNICRGKHRAIASFDAQNGKAADLKPVLKAHCRSSRHRHGHHRHNKGHRH